MKKYAVIFFLTYQSVYGFWLFKWFETPEPLPPYVQKHPMMDGSTVYGVGSGKSFLEAKSKALNDIATQLKSDVRSLTSVHKNSETAQTQTDQQITVLTQRKIDNYHIIDESHANGLTYLLIEYKRQE
ncbi:LPP20 family lipoprotein [Sulfuricurvum sp.]|uniref:LPP20 family lipoprotein n=1 Tax=Sulfuricurvum sp. TaxID=2025608 RepID=UPI0026031E64|nr:LPP20 family lipoprotein [Sulfuricurvum sp.]MDD2780075.1 LPP20 family lipoprotein [Sulfuricurvum sp.]